MPTITPFDMTQGATTSTVSPEPAKQPTLESSEAPATPKQPEAVSPQLAALARRERAIRQQARAIQAEKQAFQTRQAEIENSVNAQWKQKLAQSPWDTMIEAGLTPDQATEIIMNKPRPEELRMSELQREIEKVKKTQEDSANAVKQFQTDQYTEAKRHMTMEAKLLVDADPAYEPIKAMGAEASIPALIEDVFHQGLPGKFPRGYVMSVEEAASFVNDYLIDEGVRIAKLKAVQNKLQPAQPAQKPFSTQEKPYVTNTLSNRMSVSTPKNTSDRERRERAILAYQGKL
jgi:hypothetical protein